MAAPDSRDRHPDPALAPAARPLARESCQLPLLRGEHVVLRELRPSDAASLHELLKAPEVSRFMSPGPQTVEAFERFIHRTGFERSGGTSACFAVTLVGSDQPIGLFQLR